MAKNIGEYDEMRIKLRLIELRDLNENLFIHGCNQKVTSVKNNGKECRPLPFNIDLNQLTNDEIEDLALKIGAYKATTDSKADVYINGLGVSIKSHRGASPAFLNHTHRAGILKVCERLNIDIGKLDLIINDYWQKRQAGVIGEDVRNSDPYSPFSPYLEYLKPIINYFLFKGTSCKDSKYPADYILDFVNPLDISTWRFSNDEYIENNWTHFVFSVRSKGMPRTYPNGTNASVIEPWVKCVDGKNKGILHGRIKF